MVFSLFKKANQQSGGGSNSGGPTDPKWAKNKRGFFHRMSLVDIVAEGLKGVGGVYCIWHAGVSPRWVYIGKDDDLSVGIEAAWADPMIRPYEVHGGLLLTWSLIVPEFRDGVVNYLRGSLKPEILEREGDGVNAGADPIPVLIPR